ncbi:MAG: DUF3990 domain-containing protein [Lachnospiraceae bacterium]|nr:DUF3990 domain-containing protein [Lachnospiraceae bacterium]
MEKKIYHGSNVEVSVPRILQNGFYKDFGYGFYCTVYEKQAKRWAITRKGDSILNSYVYTSNINLKVLEFSEMTDEWLDFVVECRMGIEHDYDIVEGPMTDDQIWNYVEGFIDGKISRDAFWQLVKFNHPTHQIVFCTERALKSIKFEGSEKL